MRRASTARALPSRALAVATLVVLLAAATSASAEPRGPTPAPTPAPTPGTARAPTQRGSSWGWLVVGPSVLAGAALTTYGLTFSCTEGARSCQRDASAAIAGGVGLAALGTVVGITIVQGGDAPRASARPREVRLALGAAPFFPRAARPGGVLLRVEGRLW